MKEEPNKSFLVQLQERKVIRVAVAYIVVGWIVMQVGEVTFESLGLPPWALTLMIVLVLLGFPIALVLAWAYEVTPEGIRKDSAGDSIDTAEGHDDEDDAVPSIAVLPFDDMSEEGNQGYFCEGIAEEILNALCKVANLRVASRMAAFQFGGKSADVTEIGEKLRVRSVLEGSVRKSGERLRITAQLVDTSNGFHLWSRQFDRRLEDIFEIQEEIADSIATRAAPARWRPPPEVGPARHRHPPPRSRRAASTRVRPDAGRTAELPPPRSLAPVVPRDRAPPQ